VEVRQAQELAPGARVALIPMARDRTAAAPIEPGSWAERTDIVFVGSYHHPPNPDAVHWFLDEIWPGVEQWLPDARFVAYGSNLPDELRARSGDRVVMHGYIEHLADAFATARIGVAPLRFGAGVKGKITSSMLAGVPVVSTPAGVEGMDIGAGAVVVAHDAGSFADAIVELWDDPERLSAISAAGLAEASFSFEAQRTAFEALLEGLGVVKP
jgi:glycosyltransferase involved in cell wall biosynthesis